MTKRMLIDATHPEETRVAIVDGERLEDFNFESYTRQNLKGNIYLAKVLRIEPSLQAAFVDYGGNRHGFLAFSDIHPDYYRIPVADREDLIKAQQASFDDEEHASNGHDEFLEKDSDEEDSFIMPKKIKLYRHYKIQEVIKRGQIMLVQVVKEERGTKGAALTTYLSLAGRYCVLMPNAGRGVGGVSRKIIDAGDRKRLREILGQFDIPDGFGVIVRTAGMERSKTEIKRDLDYLLRLWDEIREATLSSVAPSIIYAEGNLIQRVIRDLYNKDIYAILVEGEEGYKLAKTFMKMLVPSHSRKVQHYKDETVPLFHRYRVEHQIDAMHSPIVSLRSGGYIIINMTEALVAVDVNSGRSTKERHIEETALKTNLEAAEEIGRQLRLRDLAGLIVIDFIDMEDEKNVLAVEKRFRESIKGDGARIQVGRISSFGLLELSRQRLRPSIFEASTQICPHCRGMGLIRSVESTALHVLRMIEEECISGGVEEIVVYIPTNVAFYIFNQKRAALSSIEEKYHCHISIQQDDTLILPDIRIERIKEKPKIVPQSLPVIREKKEEIKEIKEEKLSDAQAQEDPVEKKKHFKDHLGRRDRRYRHKAHQTTKQEIPLKEEVKEEKVLVEQKPVKVQEEVVTTEASIIKEDSYSKRRRRWRNGRRHNNFRRQEKVEDQPSLETNEKQVANDSNPIEKNHTTKNPDVDKIKETERKSLETGKLVIKDETIMLGRPFVPFVPPVRVPFLDRNLKKAVLPQDSSIPPLLSVNVVEDSEPALELPKIESKKTKKGWWQRLLK